MVSLPHHSVLIADIFFFKPGWLQCRKDYAVYLMEDRRVMVLVSISTLINSKLILCRH
jgi:hypothetical protein